MLFIFCVIFVALAFEYVNGFHDTANAIATCVSTKVMTPRQAIILASAFNLVGALTFTAVAKTIGQGLVDTSYVMLVTIMCGLTGAIIWNLLTWWIGLPSSSSHALIGGLCGAALASAHGQWSVIKWSTGLWPKVVAPMMVAPLAGLLGGFLIMGLLLRALRGTRPLPVNRVFARLQWLSSAWMSFSHGTNDAQKTMGIIALTLYTSTLGGAFDHLPAWLHFLRTPSTVEYALKDFRDLPKFVEKLRPPVDPVSVFVQSRLSPATLDLLSQYRGSNSPVQALQAVLVQDLNQLIRNDSVYEPSRFAGVKLSKKVQQLLERKPTGDAGVRLNRLLLDECYAKVFAPLNFDIAIWVKVVCAITMAAGTAAGGWRIIKTMGSRVVRMQPIHGCAAQTTAAAIIESATHFGMPLSTTHVISGSIMGVGATKRLNAVKWSVVGRMLWAWVLTLPITAVLGFVFLWGLRWAGWAE